jgi:hypothetical protein
MGCTVTYVVPSFLFSASSSPAVWNPLGDHQLFPEHIQVLMCGKRLSHLEGCALYLLGRLYQGWIAPEIDISLDNSSSSRVKGSEGVSTDSPTANPPVSSVSSFELRNMEQAFEYLCKSLRPKYLSDDNEEVCCLLFCYSSYDSLLCLYPSSDDYACVLLVGGCSSPRRPAADQVPATAS